MPAAPSDAWLKERTDELVRKIHARIGTWGEQRKAIVDFAREFAALSQTMQPQAEPTAGEQAGAVGKPFAWVPIAKTSRGESNVLWHLATESEWVKKRDLDEMPHEIAALYLAAPGAAIAAREQEATLPPMTCKHSNRSDCALFGIEDAPTKTARPSREWYAAKIQETLDDDFVIGATPPAAIPPSTSSFIDTIQPWTMEHLKAYPKAALEILNKRIAEANSAAIPAAPSDARKLCDMYQQLAEAMGYHSGEGGMEFSPEEWASALLRDATAFRAITQPTTVQQAEPPSSLPLPSDEAINEMAFQHELIAEGSWNEDAVAFGRELLQPYAAELERLRGLINTPHTDDFFEAINLEAAHQIERFGDKHDAGKTPTDWLFLIGYLAGKAATSFIRGDQEKGKHHIISSGAVLLNWWRHVTGVHTEFRPGHGGD